MSLTWTKTKDGGCKTPDGFTVEPLGEEWRLVYLGVVFFRGDREACKTQAARSAKILAARKPADGEYTDDPDKRGFLVGPPGTTVGAWKSENETGSEFLVRMAKEKGLHPRSLLEQPHVVRDMGIDLDDYPEEDVRQLVKEAFPLAQEWAKRRNALPGVNGVAAIPVVSGTERASAIPPTAWPPRYSRTDNRCL